MLGKWFPDCGRSLGSLACRDQHEHQGVRPDGMVRIRNPPRVDFQAHMRAHVKAATASPRQKCLNPAAILMARPNPASRNGRLGEFCRPAQSEAQHSGSDSHPSIRTVRSYATSSSIGRGAEKGGPPRGAFILFLRGPYVGSPVFFQGPRGFRAHLENRQRS